MWGAVYATYSVSDLTYTSATLTYEKSGLSGDDQKLKKGERKVEVPCASASGTLYLSGTAGNADRYASIYGSNGTAYDADRQIAMTSGYNSTGIAFTSADILTEGGKYYIVFSSINGSTNYDYKINAFKYVLSSACSSGGDPVDPTFTYTTATYTIGDAALDLSTKLSSNSSGAITFAVSTSDAGTTGASIASDKNFTATTVGTATITVSQAAATGYNAKSQDIEVTVVAPAPAVCPSGLSISGTKDYTEGQTISLEAALSAGNGEITYTWYKGDDLATAKAAGSIGTGTSFSKASCATSDAGNYFCVATKDGCSDAESTAYAITVAAVSYCAELNPATSGDEPVLGTVIAMQTGSYGGSIKVVGRKQSGSFAYTANGLTFNKGGVDSVRVTLGHLIQAGTIISVTVNNQDGSKDQGFYLQNLSKTKKADMHRQTGSTGDTTYVYTAVAGDGLVGVNEFIIARGSSSAALKSLKVSNCGAELHELSSAIDPVHDPAYATITLSKTLLAAGGTATATYSAIDPAYDFDEWQISGTGATLSDSKANPVTITMGSADAVVTLKLKAASVKHTVTYYNGAEDSANKLGEELVVEGSNPTAAEIVVPHKLGYTFAGWSTTNGGAVVPLNTISVAADMPLFAVFNVVNCSAQSGTIFSVILNKPQAENCTIRSGSGYETEADLIKYGTVSGGIALAKNSSTSNHIVITEDPKLRLLGGNGKVHIQFDCALQEGDKIRTTIENQNIAYTTSDSRSTTNYFEKGTAKELTITKGHVLENASEIYLWSASSSDGKLISLEVIRPEKLAVTFNMHGHGTQVEPQNIVSGGKVTEPATASITGWDFGGWYKTYVAEPESYSDAWDFENDVVSAATELHAKWTEHVASSDATLGSLSVNGEAITIVPSQLVYAVELPFGTTAVPAVTATANDENVKAFTITQALAVDGSATIYVKAEDNTTEATYTINFSVATSKDIQLVFKTGTTPCVGSASTSTQILSNNAAVSTYINQIAFTNVEGAGDNGAEGGSLNVGKKAGNMFTLSAKPGYAFQAMNFLAKIQDATCEYSIDGGAWTELASTNTDGDECYAPFTSGTVHEFRLRSTGAEGVWIRNMQLNIVEACTPITLAWDEEPVEFEVGKAGYVIAATANNGGTISYASADNTIIDVNASTGALTIAGLGSVALSASTPEGDGTTYCANGGDPIVLSKTVKTYYLVAFDGQNGEATDEVKYYSGDAAIALPAAPSYPGYDFQGWFDAETGGNQYTEAITPATSITVYAQWVAQCAGATITTQPTGASYLTGRAATALVCEATAGAGGALSYEWFTCDDAMKTNPVAATATPSTAVAGTFYYFCKVMEEGCDVEAFSDVVTITVADKTPICLIATTVTGATAHGDVTGLYGEDKGGSADVNVSSSSYKMDKGKYIGVTLPDGYMFQEGDKVVINVKTVNQGVGFTLFDGKEGSHNLIIDTRDGNLVEAGANTVVLPAYAGSQSVYVMRENNDATGDLNSALDAVAVYRTCAPILNKVTVNGAEGKPNALNQVVFEVAASTTQSQLEAIAFDWVSNDDAWTASHAPVATNAWEFGVENTVTFTDKDGDQSVYTITVNKAIPSSDATLSALSASAGVLSPAFDPAVLNYTVALPYGTSDVPTLSATKNFVGAAEPVIVDAVTFTNRQAVSTVTVTAEDGITELTYTVTFQVERFPSIVIWDGSTMSAVAESPDATTGFAWTVTGFSSVSNYSATCGAKAYTKCLPSGGSASASRNIALNVPEGYLAKFTIVFGTHSDNVDEERGMFIGTTPTKTLDESSVLTMYSNDRPHPVKGTSELVIGEGSYYINPMASVDFYEISATLMPVGYQRNVTEGRMGTVCLPANVEAGYIYGAEVYTLLYWKYGTSYQDCQMVDFEQVDEMQAGYPYMIIPTSDKFAVVYGDETYSGDGIQMSNGFTGTINPIAQADDNVLVGKYGVVNNQIRCLGQGSYSPANRAYIDLSRTPSKEEYEAVNAPAPIQKRRVSLGRQGAQVATGLDAINASEKPMKVMIDGQMYILRGEKIYDAKGQLVK